MKETQYDLESATPRPAWQEKSLEEKQSSKNYYVRAGDIVKLGNLPYLVGLRALATIIIQAYHIVPMNTKGTSVIGSVALSTHFILGGFFTTGILLKLIGSARDRSLNNFDHVKKFSIARFIRIYPALIVMLVINSIWFYRRHGELFHLLRCSIRSLLKLQNTSIFEPNGPSNPFAHTWFLDVQDQFNLLWSLALPFFILIGTKRRIVVLCIACAFSLYIRSRPTSINDTVPFNLFKMLAGAALQLIPIPHWMIKGKLAYVAIVLFVAITSWGFSDHAYSGFTEVQRMTIADVASLFIIILFTLASLQAAAARQIAVLAEKEKGEEKDGRGGIGGSRPGATLWSYLDPLQLLEAKSLQFVSRVSYSWYLWQVPLLHFDQTFCIGYRAVGTTCMAFIVAIFSTFVLEEPMAQIRRQVRQAK